MIEAVVTENQKNFLSLRVQKILSLSLDYEDLKQSSKRLRGLRKKLKKQKPRADELLEETRKFNIKGILSKQEIASNSHFSYMLNGDIINVGEHLYCVVLEDLVQSGGETLLSLSLRNERLCGKLQVHLNQIVNTEDDIDLTIIEDNPFILGYTFGVPKIPQELKMVEIEARQKQLDTEMNRLDYNLSLGVNKAVNDPHIYEKILNQLGIVQHSTLLAYSNCNFCKKGLSYYKLRDHQNQSWAKENLVKGLQNSDSGYYDQAIVYLNLALEYDSKMEKAYTAKAHVYMLQSKYKQAFADLTKCLEINSDNRTALNL